MNEGKLGKVSGIILGMSFLASGYGASYFNIAFPLGVRQVIKKRHERGG